MNCSIFQSKLEKKNQIIGVKFIYCTKLLFVFINKGKGYDSTLIKTNITSSYCLNGLNNQLF